MKQKFRTAAASLALSAGLMVPAMPQARAISPLHAETREPSPFENARQELWELEHALERRAGERAKAPPKPEYAAALAEKTLDMLSLLAMKDLEEGRASPEEITRHIAKTEERLALAGEKGAAPASRAPEVFETARRASARHQLDRMAAYDASRHTPLSPATVVDLLNGRAALEREIAALRPPDPDNPGTSSVRQEYGNRLEAVTRHALRNIATTAFRHINRLSNHCNSASTAEIGKMRRNLDGAVTRALDAAGDDYTVLFGDMNAEEAAREYGQALGISRTLTAHCAAPKKGR